MQQLEGNIKDMELKQGFSAGNELIKNVAEEVHDNLKEMGLTPQQIRDVVVKLITLSTEGIRQEYSVTNSNSQRKEIH